MSRSHWSISSLVQPYHGGYYKAGVAVAAGGGFDYPLIWAATRDSVLLRLGIKDRFKV